MTKKRKRLLPERKPSPLEAQAIVYLESIRDRTDGADVPTKLQELLAQSVEDESSDGGSAAGAKSLGPEPNNLSTLIHQRMLKYHRMIESTNTNPTSFPSMKSLTDGRNDADFLTLSEFLAECKMFGRPQVREAEGGDSSTP